MGIYPTPFRGRALQGEHFVIVGGISVMCRQRNRGYQQPDKQHATLDSLTCIVLPCRTVIPT